VEQVVEVVMVVALEDIMGISFYIGIRPIDSILGSY
jgi:hypothetical protein